VENPVTEQLLSLVEKQIEELRLAKGDAFHPFKPERTQEAIAELNGEGTAWNLVTEILSGDWSYFDEEEADGEQIGD